VDILSSPEDSTSSLVVPRYPSVTHHRTRSRPQNAVRLREYLEYVIASMHLSIALRPDVVYASDALGAGPGIIAAQLARAALVYHEHDAPLNRSYASVLFRMRKMAAQRANFVVVPNAERGRILCEQTGQQSSKLRIVSNTPRRAEVVPPSAHTSDKLIAYFHGSITPDRLPMTVIEAIRRFDGRVRLRIAGFEVPSAPDYLTQLLALGRSSRGSPIVEYLGQIPRHELLDAASKADVGLAFMPKHCEDFNMRSMVGASNKPFDYMAAGIPLLVSDLPDWVMTYCAQGFGRCCDPSSAQSVAEALTWFLEHPSERRLMGAMGRQKIQQEWNYDTAFAPIAEELSAAVSRPPKTKWLGRRG